MDIDSKNLLRYWRNALADMDKLGLSVERMNEGLIFTLEDFQKGQLSDEQVQIFFKRAEESLKNKSKGNSRKKNADSTDEPETPPSIHQLPVIIAPYQACIIHEHGQKIGKSEAPSIVLPLWMTANLTREGKLAPPDQPVFPWIERRCLTPNTANFQYPIIGDLTRLDEFYTKNQDFFEKSRTQFSWEKLFALAENLFKFVAGENLEAVFKEEGYLLKPQGHILPNSEIYNAAWSIINTYDQYIFDKNQAVPALLKEFCSFKQREYHPGRSNLEVWTAAKRHLGQIQQKYPLSPSQRLSLSCFYDQDNNDVITIHGPPGTGKTSFLFSLIASLWVESAIEQKPPPLLVAASTNNLAVTNIIDNFQSIHRWLPDFNGYCLYLASAYKQKDAIAAHYPYLLKGNEGGSILKFYSVEYRKKAVKYYLERFNHEYGKSESDLVACQKYLHQQLLEKQSCLTQTMDMSYALHEIIHQYHSSESLEELIEAKQREADSLQPGLHFLEEQRRDWNRYTSEDIKFWVFISKFGFKESLRRKIRHYTSQYPEVFEDIMSDLNSVDEFLDKAIKVKKDIHQEMTQSLAHLKSVLANYVTLHSKKSDLQNRLGFEFRLDNLFDFSDPQSLSAQLDIQVRYPLFLLATHYWEATWLLESVAFNTCGYDLKGRRQFWSIQSMLTPCLVTTLHSGLSFFRYRTSSQEFKTLDNFIDLLIIDEAGQVLPALAGGLISVAKRALFVGDIKQIEPVTELTESIDLANAKKYAVCSNDQDYKSLKETGILCSSNSRNGQSYGNLITVGRRKAKYHLLLKEHRRCAKNIISYCNQLCYDNQLVILTEEQPSIYPQMGYAHIRGYQRKQGSSRTNPPEAEAIACWIAKNQAEILKNCQGTSLDECIGIVTPFTAQKSVIQSYLEKEGLNISKAGTIHTVQGAEKPIIIFSPVYTADDPQTHFFFDRSPNMLNVAVSRAKMSFLVFGDMDIFDPDKPDLPSGLLAKYLFLEETNEIVDVFQPRFRVADDQEIIQITTLKGHCEVLKKAFDYANEELNIVSPFLRMRAIDFDEIIILIKKHCSRITIHIYTDPTLNQAYAEFQQAVDALNDAGAKVILVKNVHSKIIAVDDKMIIEGSFNWLSAARAGRFIREECSIQYQGEKVSQFIREALAPIKKRAGVEVAMV